MKRFVLAWLLIAATCAPAMAFGGHRRECRQQARQSCPCTTAKAEPTCCGNTTAASTAVGTAVQYRMVLFPRARAFTVQVVQAMPVIGTTYFPGVRAFTGEVINRLPLVGSPCQGRCGK
jgi:hypothetical protein